MVIKHGREEYETGDAMKNTARPGIARRGPSPSHGNFGQIADARPRLWSGLRISHAMADIRGNQRQILTSNKTVQGKASSLG